MSRSVFLYDTACTSDDRDESATGFPLQCGKPVPKLNDWMNIMKKGLNHLHVHETVDSAWNRLLSVLESMQIPVFSTMDHKANATTAGLDMKEARVVSFGNPAVGTLLMQQSPEAALELPLRILVWESPAGTMLTWNDPAWIADRFGADRDSEVVGKMRKMFEALSRKMAKPQ